MSQSWKPPSDERSIDKAREGVRAKLNAMLEAAPSASGRLCVAALIAEVAIEELQRATTAQYEEFRTVINRVEEVITRTGQPLAIPKQPNVLSVLRRKASTLEQRAGNLYGEALTLYPQALSELAKDGSVRLDEGGGQ